MRAFGDIAPLPRPRKDWSLGPPQCWEVFPSQAFISVQARSLTALWMGIICETEESKSEGSEEESVCLRMTALTN